MWLTGEGGVLGESDEDESENENEMDGILTELLGLWQDIKEMDGRKRRKELQKEIQYDAVAMERMQEYERQREEERKRERKKEKKKKKEKEKEKEKKTEVPGMGTHSSEEEQDELMEE